MIEKMNEGYEKLEKINSSRHRDTAWWRSAKCLNVCSENAQESGKT